MEKHFYLTGLEVYYSSVLPRALVHILEQQRANVLTILEMLVENNLVEITYEVISKTGKIYRLLICKNNSMGS